MKIKYLYIDKDGKISLTKAELDKIMTQCYDEGYEDARAIYGSSKSLTITTPYNDYNKYGSSICDSAVTETVSNCTNSLESALSSTDRLASICGASTTETVIG